jgi:L-alanine-DL-glutamate epimerase-like enolase superfamily enzyme
MYQDPPQPKKGWIKVPDVPGIGYELDPGALKRFHM